MSSAGRYVEGVGPMGAIRCDGSGPRGGECGRIEERHGVSADTIRLTLLGHPSRPWATMTIQNVDLDFCSEHAPTLAQLSEWMPYVDPDQKRRGDRAVERLHAGRLSVDAAPEKP